MFLFCPLKFVLFLLIAIEQLVAFSFVQRKWDFLLPRDLMEKIFALESDSELDKMEVERLTDQLLKEVPRSVLDRLELPRFYSRLPFNIRWQIKDLLFDKTLSWRQKHEAIFALTQSVPPQKRRFAPIQQMPSAAVADASSSAFAQPTLAGTGHSRLFESVSALKYSVSFTFQIKELCDVLPHPLAVQIYSALASNTLNIDQKLATVESVMAELPISVLDRLFFVGVPIVDAEVRERFRRLWYDRPYWKSSDNFEGEEQNEEPKMPNEKNEVVDTLPMFLNVPPSVLHEPVGRASIRYQQHQMPLPSFTSADLPHFPPPSPNFAQLTVPTSVTIDEHYNVVAPPAAQRGHGLCAECNGIPDAMASLANIMSSHLAGPLMPKANAIENSADADHKNENDQRTEAAELAQHQLKHGKAAERSALFKMPTFEKGKRADQRNNAENEQDEGGNEQMVHLQHQLNQPVDRVQHLGTTPFGGAADGSRGGTKIRVPSFVPESNGSVQQPAAPITGEETGNVILGVPRSGEATPSHNKNDDVVAKSNGATDEKSEEEEKRQQIGTKIGKRELLTIDGEQQRGQLSTSDQRRAMIIRHKKRRTDRFRGRLQMRHVNRLLGILQKQKKVAAAH
ncbi:hypothetical protein niasHS_016076 [Heterodera schachtii]|uniref:Uncharacterized protein n=1 Tax=Heterodera schachtii TaxID=97005 RepID=A0ABD2I763_HETSC